MSNKTAKDIRDAALKATVPEETVEVSEWDATVTVKGLLAGDAIDLYDAASKEERGKTILDRKLWSPALLIACVFDSAGEHVFEAADRDAIQQMPASVVTQLVTTAAALSGFGDDDDSAVAEDFSDGPSNDTS